MSHVNSNQAESIIKSNWNYTIFQAYLILMINVGYLNIQRSKIVI